MTATVHLRRTREHTRAIDALAARHRGAVGIEDVLSHLNRQATAVSAPGNLVTEAFTWEERDNVDLRWWPQGITWSSDAGAPEGVIATSWYAKSRAGVTLASRITVVDVASLRYRHVLLVEPRRWFGGLRPLRVHAGGIVWLGPSYLHVAGTRRGILTCRMDDIIKVKPSRATLGHRYVLPVRFAYDAAAGDMRYSFLSLDRSCDPPCLVAGEYGRASMTTRLARYRLDGDHLAADNASVTTPSLFEDRGVSHMQGAVTVGDTWYVTRSRGAHSPGELHVGAPGDFRVFAEALPPGPEDISYWPARDQLWSQSEHPGRRYVFAVDRSRLNHPTPTSPSGAVSPFRGPKKGEVAPLGTRFAPLDER